MEVEEFRFQISNFRFHICLIMIPMLLFSCSNENVNNSSKEKKISLQWAEEDVDPTEDNPQGRGEQHITDSLKVYLEYPGSYNLAVEIIVTPNLEYVVIDTTRFELHYWPY